jgi:hypothetical protein
MNGRLDRDGILALLGTLGALVAVNLPELGSDPWPFRTEFVHPEGILAPLVRAAGEEWDVGIARAATFVAGVVVALAGAVALRRRSWPAGAAVALAGGVALLLLAPSTLLQIGLRDATAPWFHTNDSTYQIEISGDLLLDGDNPYGHDYRFSGLERFYTRDGTASNAVRDRELSLVHYAYFPGAALTAALWRPLPEPFDDYRLFVLLSTLASLFAVMLFRAPLSWRLVLGVAVAANPIAVRSAWFGQNDAPSILFMILGFALFTRERYAASAASLGAAVLLKQFALVAVPFLAVMLVKRRVGPGALKRAAAAFAGVIAAGVVPFAIADPVAFYEDTVKFGAGTFRIVGYGLSAMLIRIGVLEDREGSYPFVLFALVLWLPLTVWLLVTQYRSRELWIGAAGFAISILVLLFIGRTFNNYYLIWPMMGVVIAAAMWAGERALPSAPAPADPRLAEATKSEAPR